MEWHAGELFPRVGFMVTNLKGRAKKVVYFYNRRGTAEQWIKEGKNAVKWTGGWWPCFFGEKILATVTLRG